MTKVLFVCLGNICRSPTADGVFRHMLIEQGLTEKIEVDSCGTAGWHIGKAPDQRSQASARRRGYDLSCLRARQVNLKDFETFDYILAMDESNRQDLLAMSPNRYHEKIRLFLDYAQSTDLRAVPDPYYDGEAGFEQVLDLVEEACHGLINQLRSSL